MSENPIDKMMREKIIEDYDFQGIKKKRAELREKGSIVDSLEELTCELHDESSFSVVSEYPLSFKFAVCDTCIDEYQDTGRPYVERRIEELRDGKKFMLPEIDLFTSRRGFEGESAYLCEIDAISSVINKRYDIEIEGCGWVKGFPEQDDDFEPRRQDPRIHTPVPHFNVIKKYKCGVCDNVLAQYSLQPEIRY